MPPPLAAPVTRWSQDPFALGSCSCHATGFPPASRTALARCDWDGRLIFAGKATEPRYTGATHIAYLSGQISARRIQERAP